MHVLRGHRGPVVGLAYSPDGRILASASTDGTARLWDTGTGREVHKMQSPLDRARCVAFSKDGRLLAAGYESDRGFVQLWELPGLRRLEQWRAHQQSTRAVGFSRIDENQRLVTCGDQPSLAAWELPTTASAWSTEGMTTFAMAVSACERFVATLEALPTRIRFWEMGTQTVLHRKVVTPAQSLEFRGGFCVAFSPISTSVVAGLESRSGRGILARVVLDARTDFQSSWPAHDGSILGVAFLPDGQSLLSAATDGLVKHWSLTGELIRSIDWQIGELGAVAIAPDGLTAAVGGAEDIVVWDLE